MTPYMMNQHDLSASKIFKVTHSCLLSFVKALVKNICYLALYSLVIALGENFCYLTLYSLVIALGENFSYLALYSLVKALVARCFRQGSIV